MEKLAFLHGYRDAGKGIGFDNIRRQRDVSGKRFTAEYQVDWLMGWYQYFVEHPPFPTDTLRPGLDPNDPLAVLWLNQ